MELFYRRVGADKPAMVIIHGLYGASDNWMSLAKIWSEHFTVYVVDQRNHGQSPHSAIHTYSAMCDDILELLDHQKINKAVILGHSMGGKTAMRLAMDYPQRVEALVVIDIAPKNYTLATDQQVAAHHQILDGLNALDLSQIQRREQVEMALNSAIPEERTKQFIMKNLKRRSEGGFEWKLNLKVLTEQMPSIAEGFYSHEINRHITGFPVLFIKGENSPYIKPTDHNLILDIFPTADIVSIPNAGHWIHAEAPEILAQTVINYLLP
jgi:pimeloyl-ACP methyl ester carboxylesterase